MSEEREWARTLLGRASEIAGSRIFIAEGYVSEVRNGGAGKVKVSVLPEGIQTNWLPVINFGSGEAFVQMGYQVNDDVIVLFLGSYDHGFVLGGFNTENNPITDFIVKHKSGATIQVSDNNITISHNGEVNVEAGTVNVNGTFVNLAGGGAGVARIGDSVQTAFGPAPIVSGSLRVKAG